VNIISDIVYFTGVFGRQFPITPPSSVVSDRIDSSQNKHIPFLVFDDEIVVSLTVRVVEQEEEHPVLNLANIYKAMLIYCVIPALRSVRRAAFLSRSIESLESEKFISLHGREENNTILVFFLSGN
jgi:hypothetical protein